MLMVIKNNINLLLLNLEHHLMLVKNIQELLINQKDFHLKLANIEEESLIIKEIIEDHKIIDKVHL